ncbi:proteoglycan Cow-like [Copidosoma floridanum]|uniref:proteoglycan Cow-like n=1 Tax=Copidosoma floridanum TaxID=29053 RepID=UPI0006C98651|nr:proteoglycan Cow-like [Copidosoma floridanum]
MSISPTIKTGHILIGCHYEVQWMFGHLDTDSSGELSVLELYGLKHDQNEPCLKPFLDACDINSNTFVSGPEWCGCFSMAERPCAAVRRRSPSEVAPSCDSQGFYQSTQCHKSLRICWCVNKHGIEIPDTRVLGSKPDCDSVIIKKGNGAVDSNSVDLEDDEDSAQDLEGSADIPLEF